MSAIIEDLNKRSLEIFKELVDLYTESGTPVGSSALSKKLNLSLSPSTIRNIMAELEEIGLLYSPHISSGRIPTYKGFRFFVDTILEQGDILSKKEKKDLDIKCKKAGKSMDKLIEETSYTLAGISKCTSIITVPKLDFVSIKHIEFIPLNNHSCMLILVFKDGIIENRIIDLPEHTTISQLNQASKYINYHLDGKSLLEVQATISEELKSHKIQLDKLTKKIIQQGLATWTSTEQSLVIRGQSSLLNNLKNIEDIENIKALFYDLNTKENINRLVEASLKAQGVKIFIGAEDPLFKKSDCSMILKSYENQRGNIMGAVGVIGPINMNYRKIIPIINYFSKLIEQFIES